MSKERVVCPECGYHHTVRINGSPVVSTGVRSKRITGNQFEYSLTVPAQIVEAGRVVGVTDDLLLSGAFGIACGALVGSAIAPLLPADLTLQVLATSASAGTVLAYGWLCAEHNQRLKSVVPWFMRQRQALREARAEVEGEGVSLTVDHRYRDGHTESGRTINYFGTLPIEVERFNAWAQDALRGDSLAIAHWTGKDKPFSRQEYERLLDLMRRAGAVINTPGKGNQLTGGGRRALTQHLKQEKVL